MSLISATFSYEKLYENILSSPTKSRQECDFICEFDRSSMRESFWETCDMNIFTRHVLSDIERRGFSFDIRIGRYNNFLYIRIVMDAFEQVCQCEICRQDPMNRWDSTSENMVASAEHSESFESDHIEIIFDDTERVHITRCIITDTA